MSNKNSSQVIIIAIGGPTCSGKTTLAKHLHNILPDSLILHQDDFAPPSHLVPIHPIHQVQDWDDPETGIEWKRFRSVLEYTLKNEGRVPSEHYSHDHLNVQALLSIPQTLTHQWQTKFASLTTSSRTRYIIVDGFQLYWDRSSVEFYNVKLFVRESESVLHARRNKRQIYHTAAQSELVEGIMWQDPPHYWENVAWPGYIKGHRHLFVDGQLEHGPVDVTLWDGLCKDVVLLQPPSPQSTPLRSTSPTNDGAQSGHEDGADQSNGMSDMVSRACEEIWDTVNKSKDAIEKARG